MNKILDLIVWEGLLDVMAKNMGLRCKPFIVYDDGDGDYVMMAQGKTHRKLFTVTGSSTDGRIKVNAKNLAIKQHDYKKLCGLNKVAYDMTIVLLLHECRHLWQLENGFFNGDSAIHISFGPHGQEREEDDANTWVLEHTVGKMHSVAEVMVYEQSYSALSVDDEWRKEFHYRILNMVKHYNWIKYMIARCREER